MSMAGQVDNATKEVLWSSLGTGTNQVAEQKWVSAYMAQSGVVEIYKERTIVSQGYGMDERGVCKGHEPVEVDLVH